MNRFFGAVLAAGLVLGGGTAARAGAFLTSGTAQATQSGYTDSFDWARGGWTQPASFSGSSSQSVGSPSPSSAAAVVTTGPLSLGPGNLSSLDASTLMFLSNGAGGYQLRASAVSGGGASSRPGNPVAYTGAYDFNWISGSAQTSGAFTLTSPYRYTLDTPVSASTQTRGQADWWVSYGSSYGNGSYYLTGGYPAIEGSKTVPDQSPPSTYVGYTRPSSVVSGVLQPGQYAFGASASTRSYTYYHDASASASVSQGYTLTLTPLVDLNTLVPTFTGSPGAHAAVGQGAGGPYLDMEQPNTGFVQVTAPALPNAGSDLTVAFDYQFTTPAGKLQILYGGQVLGTIIDNGTEAPGSYSHTFHHLTPGGAVSFRLSNDGDPGIQLSNLALGSSFASPAATPEPSTFVLLGMAGVSLAGYGWRRRKLAATA